MKTISVRIQGTSPYLMHRFTEQTEEESKRATRRVNIKQETPREQAQRVVYQNKEGHFYFPGAAIMRLLREAGGAHKQKGSRKSTKFIVPAAVRINHDAIVFYNGTKPLADFEVDSRPVTIPATKGRIMRHRPRFDEWSARFTIAINDEILPPDFVHQLLVEGGQQIGIGDFRPEKGGPFGTFNVTEWSA